MDVIKMKMKYDIKVVLKCVGGIGVNECSMIVLMV